MSAALANLIRRQTEAIARQFANEPANAHIGIRGIDAMSGRKLAFGGRSEPLESQPTNRCFVYVDRDGNPELWVWAVLKKGPGGSAYETDWNAFARKYFQVDYASLDTSDYNIDHLYPETTGHREGMTHVRVMPVPKDSNQAVGRTLEKLMANRHFPPGRIAHKASVVTFAKIAGFAEHITLPENRGQPVDPGVIQRLVKLLQAKGFLADDALTRALTQHLTSWTVTKLQGGDIDALGVFRPE